MNKSKVHVYIVHQFAQITGNGTIGIVDLEDHKIIGVYNKREYAESHRRSIMLHRARKEMTREKWEEIIPSGPYIAITKHTVRG